MLGEFNGFFITKQIEKPWPCSVEHSRNGDKHSTTPRVSPYTSFVFQPFPVCFTTEQSTVKTSLLVKYKYDLKFQTMIRRQIFTLANISWYKSTRAFYLLNNMKKSRSLIFARPHYLWISLKRLRFVIDVNTLSTKYNRSSLRLRKTINRQAWSCDPLLLIILFLIVTHDPYHAF